MQKNDDLLLDDEFASTFLGDDLSDNPTSIDTIEENVEQAAEWEETDNDAPGELAVDVYETEDRLVIKARTAGVDRKDLEVSISEGVLTISGTLSGGEDTEAIKFYEQECYWGDFTRSIQLLVPIKEDKVEAVLKEGVLTISFEKIKPEQGKKINIQSL